MSNKTIYEIFDEKFEGYQIIINPPCISWNRELQYIEDTMRFCLGETKLNGGNIIIDHKNKRICQ